MANQSDKHRRDILPIPDREYVGLTTYDAKDPDTKFPPIEPLRPPKGAPNVLDHSARRRGLRRLQCFWRSHQHADSGTIGAKWLALQPFSYHRALLADPPGNAHWTQPPFREHGRHL